MYVGMFDFFSKKKKTDECKIPRGHLLTQSVKENSQENGIHGRGHAIPQGNAVLNVIRKVPWAVFAGERGGQTSPHRPKPLGLGMVVTFLIVTL